jgi:glyoxylase I family protein
MHTGPQDVEDDKDGLSLQRRRLLQILSYAFGSNLLGNKFAMATQNAAQSASPASPWKSEVKNESKGTEMEKVAGIGGLFFRAKDPKALGIWYEQHLGINLTPTGEGGSAWQQEAGATAFTPFPESTKYFGDLNKAWMVNFRVHNLDKMVAQLRAAGIEVKDPESYPGLGSFTRLHDPEGNPIELWQPA